MGIDSRSARNDADSEDGANTLVGIEAEERAYQETADILRSLSAAQGLPRRAPCKVCDRCERRTGELLMSSRGSVCFDCYVDVDD